MIDPMTLAIAMLLGQGVIVCGLLLVVRSFGHLTREIRKERLAAEVLHRSNLHLLDALHGAATGVPLSHS